MKPLIKVIIPAFNEQNSIVKVIKDLPKMVEEIIVVNNNSTDETAKNAKNAGATVLHETKKGYGFACLKGINYIENQNNKPSIVVFLDGDYSDFPEQLSEIIQPIIQENIDFVVGARLKNLREQGSMTPQQIFGNWLATSLMKFFLIQNLQI